MDRVKAISFTVSYFLKLVRCISARVFLSHLCAFCIHRQNKYMYWILSSHLFLWVHRTRVTVFNAILFYLSNSHPIRPVRWIFPLERGTATGPPTRGYWTARNIRICWNYFWQFGQSNTCKYTTPTSAHLAYK